MYEKSFYFLMGTFESFPYFKNKKKPFWRTKEFILWCFVLAIFVANKFFQGKRQSMEWQRICLSFCCLLLICYGETIKKDSIGSIVFSMEYIKCVYRKIHEIVVIIWLIKFVCNSESNSFYFKSIGLLKIASHKLKDYFYNYRT